LVRWRVLTGGGLALLVAALCVTATPAFASPRNHPKLDPTLNARAKNGQGKSRVIVVFKSAIDGSEVKKLGGSLGRRLNLIGAQVAELSNGQLKKLADHPAVASIHHDRPFAGTLSRAAIASGARTVQYMYGLNGAGVGVAVIDSGVTSYHEDLQDSGTWSADTLTSGGQRVAAFVDFVNGQTTAYDDYGHGTHVSGTIAGNGYNSLYATRAGIAPGAHLVSLKVLNGQGRGVISNVIAALEYAIANKDAYNIRVINLSVGAAVTESYRTDPLTLAAKRAVDAGIVVVAAAGNLGKNALGQPQYGGITAPGNAPWVLTVGASSHEGTLPRYNDVVAGYSSRGPTRFNYAAKPDLVAHGTGIVSLSSPGSWMYLNKPQFLLPGIHNTEVKPYLSLSGTSMAAPVVSGTVALMLQANPNLTPNLVKAILQYTSQQHASYNVLTQGAGFLNSRGAVDLARYFATAQAGDKYPSSRLWSRQVIWGNYRLRSGAISPSANAFQVGTAWGAASDEDGDNIVWGTRCDTEDCDNIVWGTSQDGGNTVWGTTHASGNGIVWGASCPTVPLAGEDCDNIVWGTAEDEDNIVWGTDCNGEDCDNIVWGTGSNGIVWGTAEDGDNIVWGTSCPINPETGQEDCDNIVWGTSCPINPETGQEDCDNIVWGTACNGNEDCDNIVWGTSVDVATNDGASATQTVDDESSWMVFIWDFEALFVVPQPTTTTSEPVTSTTSEPVTSTTSEPVTSTTSDPVTSTTSEPVTTTTSEPVTSTTSEPVTSTTSEPVASTTSQPVTSTTSESVTSTTSDSTTITTTTSPLSTTTATSPSVTTTTTVVGGGSQ